MPAVNPPVRTYGLMVGSYATGNCSFPGALLSDLPIACAPELKVQLWKSFPTSFTFSFVPLHFAVLWSLHCKLLGAETVICLCWLATRSFYLLLY